MSILTPSSNIRGLWHQRARSAAAFAPASLVAQIFLWRGSTRSLRPSRAAMFLYVMTRYMSGSCGERGHRSLTSALPPFWEMQLRQHAAHAAAPDALDRGNRHRDDFRVGLEDSPLRRSETAPRRRRQCDDRAACGG